MDILYSTLVSAFLIALVVGAVANKTSFCTMGAVSDLVNIGDGGRLRAWVLAIATAILGVAILDSLSVVDMSLANSGETAKPPYASPQFAWLRYVVGGLLFGVGMTLGSGCGNKTLVRIGGGNMKSVVVFLAMGVGAYLMIFTDFGFDVFLRWMQPLTIDFAERGMAGQGLSDFLAWLFGAQGDLRLVVALALGAALLAWVFANPDMRARAGFDNVLGGVTIGAAVVAAWYVTAGPMGETLLEELEFLDVRPFDVGAQSLTFVKPSAHFLHYLSEGADSRFVTFALMAAAGVVVGSLIYALASRGFRFEWFASIADFARHLIGGLLMGVGGVLALGCTVGQAISGASTLALGSFLTFAMIFAGAAISMKIQYWMLMREA